jgi:hypothetical protein
MEYRREDDDDDELSFSYEPIDCCESIVDMVGPTRITANIRASHKIAKYNSKTHCNAVSRLLDLRK